LETTRAIMMVLVLIHAMTMDIDPKKRQ